MKSRFSAVFVCSLVLVNGPVSGQSAGGNETTSEVAELRLAVQELRSELVRLRATVAQLELERHRDNIDRIKAELSLVREEQARLADADESRQQDVGDLDELLARGEFDPGQRSHMQAARADLAISRAKEIADQSQTARARERELLRRLETEEQVAKRLNEAWKFTGGKRNELLH